MDFENINIWYWLILFIVGVLCAIIGYFLGKGSNGKSAISAELRTLQEKCARLEADLVNCNQKLSNREGGFSSFAVDILYDPKAATRAFKKKIRENDLKIVEGIGPKIEGLFHNFDIKTWKALSETSVAKCQEVLDSGGERFKVHVPASWPMQAKMCYENKWKELYKWQEEHDHGKL